MIESPLSLLLYRFVEVSISSCSIFISFVLFVFSFFLRFWTFYGFSFFPHSVFLFSLVLAAGDYGALDGDFLPRVTWVLSSSSLLLGLSPVSFGCASGMLVFCVLFVVIVVDGTGEVVAVADTNEVVAIVSAVDVVVTVVLVVFCGHDLEKWPICLQCQHCGLRPSATTIMA